MDATTAGLLGAAIGGIITAAPTIVTFWMGKRSDERRHLRELAFRGAVDNWKEISERARHVGVPVDLQPLDVFLVHMLKLAEVATKEGLSAKNVGDRLREVQEVVLQASSVAEEFTKRTQKRAPEKT